MPKTRTPALVALVVLLVLALAQPAGAADSLSEARRKREDARRRRAQVAAQLDHLKASDAELESAVSVLDGQVRAQLASAEAARQALQSARAAVADAETRIAATEAVLGVLHAAVVDRAVAAYVRPRDEGFTHVIDARDVNEASRRNTLLDQVNNNDRDVIDRLRAVREDLADERAKLDKARKLPEERGRAERARLADLQQARVDQQRAAGALQGRIAEYEAEASAMAQQEAGLAALIKSREQGLAARVAVAPGGGGGGRPFVDPGTDGKVSGAGLIWPLRGSVTSPYGYRWGRLHAGIDISAGTGTPIRAAKGGTVIFSGTMSGYGNCVVIDHGGGFSTLYAHQSRVAVGDGAGVSQGQVIGAVGSTGHSTGPHLHFETRVGGSPQNPMRYLP